MLFDLKVPASFRFFIYLIKILVRYRFLFFLWFRFRLFLIDILIVLVMEPVLLYSSLSNDAQKVTLKVSVGSNINVPDRF